MSSAFKKIKKKAKSVFSDAHTTAPTKLNKFVKENVRRPAMGGVQSAMGTGPVDPPPPPKVAPISDDESAARSSSRTRQRMKRSGRTSTVLTSGSKLG